MCDSEFALPSHCERHMTAAHSGFGHLCSSCGLVFARRDSRHGCKNYSLQIVKRSSRTFTGEEAIEFENFQKSRSKFCIPFMKSLPPSNYSLFHKSAKRAILTEPLIPKKKRRYSARPQIPALMELELPIPNTVTVISSQEDKDVQPTPFSSSSPQNGSRGNDDTTVPVDLPESLPKFPVDCEDKQEESNPLEKLADDLQLSESTESRQDDEISLLTDGIIDQDETPSTHYDRSNQPKAVVEPPKAPSLGAPVPTLDKKAAKMLALKSQQQELVTLNVGGILYQTNKATLQADPSSILASIASTCRHGPSRRNFDFFLDRNPRHYGFIIDYLRNNCKVVPSTIPRDVSTSTKSTTKPPSWNLTN